MKFSLPLLVLLFSILRMALNYLKILNLRSSVEIFLILAPDLLIEFVLLAFPSTWLSSSLLVSFAALLPVCPDHFSFAQLQPLLLLMCQPDHSATKH